MLLADLILMSHLLFVAFVAGSVPVVWFGARRGWSWVRNRAFRVTHLAAIVFVALESLLGSVCPLTVWEYALRGETSELGFIQRGLRELLYWDLPGWVFTFAYCAFALLVIVTWLRIPPRRRD
jgi:hypothetical protein